MINKLKSTIKKLIKTLEYNLNKLGWNTKLTKKFKKNLRRLEK